LRSLVQVQILEWQDSEEENIAAHVDNCIIDAIYGDSGISLLKQTLESPRLLLEQDVSWWHRLLESYFIAPSIDVLAFPSPDAAASRSKDEAALVAEQAAFYGPSGLQACQSLLDSAVSHHKAMPPPNLFSQFPVQTLDGVDSIPYSCELLCDQGVAVNFTHVKSKFVTIYMVFDTTEIPAEIMKLLPLVSELFFAVDIAASSSFGQMHWSEVVSSLQTFSLGQSFGLGVGGSCFYSGSFETTACASIRAHEDSAAAAMQWLLSLVNHAAPSAERIRVYVRHR
jgi:Zn-dependent M16 (insulinase) family peptidase